MQEATQNRLAFALRRRLTRLEQHGQRRRRRQRPPPFDECMPSHRSLRLRVWDDDDRAWLQALACRYAEGADELARPRFAAAFAAIPQTVHHIWLGGPLPARYRGWVSSWRLKHPHWEHRMWTDADLPSFKLINQAAFDAAANYGEKSDIWRYEILHRFGGLYVDTDFECLGCFDSVLRPFELVTGISNTGTVELNNGLIACRPKHPLMNELISSIGAEFTRREQLEKLASLAAGNTAVPEKKSAGRSDPMQLIAMMAGLGGGATVPKGSMSKEDKAKAKAKRHHEACMATISRTGPGIFTRSFMALIMAQQKAEESNGEGAPPDEVAFPCSYFYPVPNDWMPSKQQGCEEWAQFLRPESLAVHHWARSWQQ